MTRTKSDTFLFSSSSFGLRCSLAIFLLLLSLSSRAEEPTRDVIAEASQAIEENLPQVAISKLKDFLNRNPAASERAVATRQLARALLDAGRADEALKNLSGLDDAESTLLRAMVFNALGRWPEALATYHRLTSAKDSPFVQAAAIGEADALHALGRPNEAILLLQNFTERNASVSARLRLAHLLIETRQIKRVPQILAGAAPRNAVETKWKKYLEGRLLLTQDQPAPALVAFEQVLKDPHDVTENLLAGATIGTTEARAALNGLEIADNVLEDFIWRYPDSTYLEEMFVRLDRIYTSEENASETELQRWAQRAPKRRAALAQFYYAKAQQREKKPERAIRALNDFTRQYPDHPLIADAWMLLGRLYLDTGKIPAAVNALESAMRQSPDADARARAELAMGVAYFKQREFLLAANAFQNAAARSEKVWQQATYDAALAWLNLGNYDRFFDAYKTFSERDPESELRRNLLLEEGLLQARSHDPRATTTLGLFVRDFPKHPRVPEAEIALAELAFGTSDLPGAGRYLKAAYESSPNEQQTERADYLAIFVADAAKDRDDLRTVELCQKFVREHPASALKPDVRMKLGQIYFRREDFSNAQTQFETLASESPNSALAEPALFLAGQSAMRSMNGADRALEIFGRVAELNGPLKLYARQEQAIAKTQLGKESEAITVYDDILRSDPDSVLRLAALCGKADNLVATTTSDPHACEKAMAIYDELATDTEVTRFWKDQALYKKAKCLERLKQPNEALVVLYEVLQQQNAVGAEPEYFWYYKAGFDAARMLETQEQWKGAIGIYEKMAKTPGPRADEAKKRGEQLRLERFIWE